MSERKPRRPKGGTPSLTAERLREVVTYNKTTGVFVWLVARGSIKPGSIAGCDDGDGYLVFQIDGVLHKAHRLAWLYVTGEWPEDLIDHRNRIRSDNRFSNLRQATNQQNLHNRDVSTVAGFYWYKRHAKWAAHIRIDGKTKWLGMFENSADARQAYLDAKKHYHPFAFSC